MIAVSAARRGPGAVLGNIMTADIVRVGAGFRVVCSSPGLASVNSNNPKTDPRSNLQLCVFVLPILRYVFISRIVPWVL